MKKFVTILLLLLSLPVFAEQTVEHGGRQLVTFDVPGIEYTGQREGKQTRTFFSQEVGSGHLKITVVSRGWLSEDKAEESYKNDKTYKREEHYTRVGDDADVPGALHALTYTISSPYEGRGVIVYTKDFRCDLLVTGTEEAVELIKPTFDKLVQTLKVVPRAGKLQVE